MTRAGLRILSALLLIVGVTDTAPAADPQSDPPNASQQIAGARIGWTYGAEPGIFDSAKADGKPVVVLFSSVPCDWCQRMEHQALRCPLLNTLAGEAHFVLERREISPLGLRLGINDFPTISLFSVKGTDVNEVKRLTGYVDEPELMQQLEIVGLRSPGGNPLGDAPTGAPPDHPRACLSSSVTAATPATQGDVDKALQEQLKLRPSPAPGPPALTDRQRQAIANRQALDGQLGYIARIRAAWRLGETNILAEEAGRLLAYLIIALAVWFLLFRKKKTT